MTKPYFILGGRKAEGQRGRKADGQRGRRPQGLFSNELLAGLHPMQPEASILDPKPRPSDPPRNSLPRFWARVQRRHLCPTGEDNSG